MSNDGRLVTVKVSDGSICGIVTIIPEGESNRKRMVFHVFAPGGPKDMLACRGKPSEILAAQKLCQLYMQLYKMTLVGDGSSAAGQARNTCSPKNGELYG
jgi:hypothetical protein